MITDTGKVCSKCETDKPLTEFYKSHNKQSKPNPMGYKSHCKTCVKKQRNEYYKTPEGHKYQIEKSWRDKGMLFTTEEYQELLEEQAYGCAICGVKSNKNGSRLCVDHNHATGSIRGLLCHDCNTTLGKFNDEVEMFYKAIDYLEKYNVKD
jgi:hypothetical protein